MNLRRFLFGAAMAAFPLSAHAGTTTWTATDFTGAHPVFFGVTDGSGNIGQVVSIGDGVALGSRMTVTAGAALVTANAGTNLNTSLLALEGGGNLATLVTDFGAPGASACATDTASCSLNQQMQRLAQRLSSLITALGTPIQTSGGTVTANQGGAPWSFNQTQINGSAVSTAAAGIAKIGLTDGSGNAITSDTRGSTRPLAIEVLDASGTQITSFGGSNASVGTVGSAVPASATYVGFRNGTGNLDYALVDASHNLAISCGGVPCNITDEAAFTAGSTGAAAVGGFYQTTATSNALSTGQFGSVQLTANRAMFANLRNASGTEIGVAATPLQVSVANTAANAAAMLVTGTGGTFPATQSGTWTVQPGNTANTTAWLITGTGGTFPVSGVSASGAANSGNPVKIGGAFNTVQPTVTNGQTVDAQMTARGAQIVSTGTDTFNVTCANCSGSGVSQTDEGAFTAGSSLFASGGGFFQTTATSNALTTGQFGSFQVTANRALFVNPRDSAGSEIADSTLHKMKVSNSTAADLAATVTGAVVGHGTAATAMRVELPTDGTGVVGLNAGTNVIGHVIADTGSTTAVTQATAASLNATVVGTGTFVVQAGQAASGASNAGNPVKMGVVFNTTQPTVTNGQVVDAQGTSRGAVIVSPGVETFNTSAAQTGTWTVQPGNTANTTAWLVNAQPTAATTGGTTNYHVIAAASDNHVVIKNGAGTVYDIECSTSSTAAAYVRLYDAGTGFNGCNSATNIVWGSVCPASASASGVGAGFMKSFLGKAFASGISICITGAFTDTDTTNAPTTAIVNVGYK